MSKLMVLTGHARGVPHEVQFKLSRRGGNLMRGGAQRFPGTPTDCAACLATIRKDEICAVQVNHYPPCSIWCLGCVDWDEGVGLLSTRIQEVPDAYHDGRYLPRATKGVKDDT